MCWGRNRGTDAVDSGQDRFERIPKNVGSWNVPEKPRNRLPAADGEVFAMCRLETADGRARITRHMATREGSI